MNKLLQGMLAVGLNAALLLGSGHPAQAAGGGGGTVPPAGVPTPTQMRSWMFSPMRLDFQQGGTPTVANVPGAPTTSGNGAATAAAFDYNNNLLFYSVRSAYRLGDPYYGADVYTPSGAFAINGNSNMGAGVSGTYSAATNRTYSFMGQEMGVVPMPGTCRQFSLLYTMSTSAQGGNSALISTIVDCSGATPEVTTTTIVCEIPGTQSGFAVSKMTNGTRYVYTVGGGAILRTPLTSAGFGTTVVDLTTALFAPSEVDLSPDGTRLAFGGGVNSVKGLCRANVNPSTGVVSNLQVTQTDPSANTSGSMQGVEFSPDNTKIYYGGGYSGFSPAPGPTGIYEYTIATGGLRLLAGTRAFGQSMIEAAYDGLLYAIGNYDTQTGGAESERLLAINPATGTAALSPVTTRFQSLGNGGGYVLPDQIDGEDYKYFFGTPAPTLTGLSIAGNVLNASPGSFGGMTTNLYACQALPLTATATNAATYSVSITEALADGTLPAGGYQFATQRAAALPADLRTLNGSYLLTHPGYYRVVVTAYNGCLDAVQRAGFIRVATGVATATNFRFSTGQSGAGLQLPGSAGSPTAVGGYGGAVDFSQITEAISGLQLRIEDVAGNFLVVDTGVLNAANNIGLVNLNNMVYVNAGPFGGTADYFASNIGRVYKLTLTLVSGSCGSAVAIGYFTPSTTAYRSSASTPLAPTTVAPNPLAHGLGTLTYTLPQDQSVRVVLMDVLTGKEVREVQAPARQKAGEHALRLDASGLPAGVYLYKLLGEGKVETGRVIVGE